MFVPDEDSLNDIVYTVKSKFDFVDTIKIAINDMEDIIHNLNGTPQLTVDVESKYYTGEITFLDMSWYAQFKPYGDVILTGFIYVFFLWRLYVHLPGIISGSSAGMESGINIAKFEGGKK